MRPLGLTSSRIPSRATGSRLASSGSEPERDAADSFTHIAPKDRITHSKTAARAFRRVQPGKQREAIRDAIVDLVREPRPDGRKKLTSGHGAYRIRVGDYRVICEIHEGRIRIQVLTLGPRGDIYKR